MRLDDTLASPRCRMECIPLLSDRAHSTRSNNLVAVPLADSLHSNHGTPDVAPHLDTATRLLWEAVEEPDYGNTSMRAHDLKGSRLSEIRGSPSRVAGHIPRMAETLE